MKLPAGRAAAWGIALLSTVLFACQTGIRRNDPFAAGIPLSIDDPRVAAGLATLEVGVRTRQSIVASASLSLEGPDVQLNRPQRLAARRPASLRVEILGLFGQIAAILVTDGSTYQLWDVSAAGAPARASGEVTRELLWSVAQVDLDPAEVVELLLGDPTAGLPIEAVAAVESGDGDVAVALTEDGGQGGRTVEFDAAGRLVRALRYDARGALLWDATFADYRPLAGELLAYEVRIAFPRLEARARFQLERAELNRQLPDSVFTLPRR